MEENWSKLSNLSIQDNGTDVKYYVVIRETILSRLKGSCSVNIGKVKQGMLVQAIGSENNESLRVQVYSKTNDEIWHQTEWKCHPVDLRLVSPLFWHLLISVPSLEDRTRLTIKEEFCRDVENIKLNSDVWYCPASINPVTYLASVKFIGPVSELGDGYYFGLDVVDNPNICGPCSLVKKYFTTSISSGTFTTVSNINPRKTKPLEAIWNFEKNFLSNDILKSKETDNFFVTKNKEATKSKENIDVLQPNKFPLIVDTDNNNHTNIRPKNVCVSSNILHEPIKPSYFEQKNYNTSLYSNLKIFDPLLNSDEESDKTPKFIQQSSKSNDLSIGSCVKVLVDSETHYGVIRWIGSPEGNNTNKLMAAIELDDIHPLATDGTYQNVRYFNCGPQKAWFADVADCRNYDIAASNCYYSPPLQDFDSTQSTIVRPHLFVKDGDLEKVCGRYRGIQGHHNSCYLDATLFSMFAFTCVFDKLLYRPPNEKDCPQYEEVQRVLLEKVVNPLRKDLFVGADQIMELRTLLEKSSSISGLTSEEKDPEEFLTSLVAQTLNAEPFLLLSSGQDAYHYQLFVEKDERLVLPTVQQLLEQSFMTSDIKLKEVPSCFIIQMPRFGKAFKMYPKIQPTLLLDVTDIIENSPRQCTVCGKLAKFECKECYGQCGEGLESIAFCKECLDKAHCHEKRNKHQPKSITVPMEYEFLNEHQPVPRLYLELLAVVCIETSHYVSFVKCAPGSDAPWCFFDSMADRIGEQNGYNIPEMVACPNFPYWLSEEGANYLATVTDDRSLPEHAKRLLCDAYMCMYQSPSIAAYK